MDSQDNVNGREQESPSVGIVVPCKDEVATLARCLNALRRLNPPVEQIVVVDNGSTDGSLEVARQYADEVLVLPAASISALRNSGARALPPVHIIGFVDADCEVGPTWLQAGLAALHSADLVGSRTEAASDATWVARRWARVEASRAQAASKVWSQHMLIRRQTFNELHGFDEGLPTGEDADLSIRLVAAGGTLVLVPEMVAVHYGFPTDLRGFLRRERWHTRASGWYPRMSGQSRALVLGGALWSFLGLLSQVAALTGRPLPARWWAGVSAAGVPLLGFTGARSVRHAGQDGVLLSLWLLVRVLRAPRELVGLRRRPPTLSPSTSW